MFKVNNIKRLQSRILQFLDQHKMKRIRTRDNSKDLVKTAEHRAKKVRMTTDSEVPRLLMRIMIERDVLVNWQEIVHVSKVFILSRLKKMKMHSFWINMAEKVLLTVMYQPTLQTVRVSRVFTKYTNAMCSVIKYLQAQNIFLIILLREAKSTNTNEGSSVCQFQIISSIEDLLLAYTNGDISITTRLFRPNDFLNWSIIADKHVAIHSDGKIQQLKLKQMDDNITATKDKIYTPGYTIHRQYYYDHQNVDQLPPISRADPKTQKFPYRVFYQRALFEHMKERVRRVIDVCITNQVVADKLKVKLRQVSQSCLHQVDDGERICDVYNFASLDEKTMVSMCECIIENLHL